VSLRERFESFAVRAAKAEAPTTLEGAMRGLLTVGSAVYGGLVRVRNAGYNTGLLRTWRLPCRVVCVGNLTAGGTGKTPAVMALAAAGAAGGSRVCILLRGYGRQGGGVRVVSEGGGPLLDWREAGDEAVLLARRLPGVPVVVGEDRFAAGRLAVERFRPQVIFLDDGFQHRRLHRDADLVLVDAMDPFGGGRLLPRGRLREPVSGLRRARAFLLTRADQGRDPEGICRRVESVAPGRPIGRAVLRLLRLRDLTVGCERPATEIRGKRVLAVSGIGNPDSFHRTVTESGAVVVGSLAYRDHHAFMDEDRGRMAEAATATKAEWIVTTEKDAVRLAGQLPSGCPVVVLEVVLEIVEGAEAVETALGVPVRVRRG
jgi:tetraacyldisaccharide 4'-kinase